MRLEARSLTLAYGKRRVVDGVSFTVESGEMVAVAGPNGSGKSTLLRGLARLHRPHSGSVLLGETDIRALGARDVARRLAILPQSPSAAGDLTVRELVWRGRYPHQGVLQRAVGADYEAVAWALSAAHLDDLADRPLGELSGGECQRAWIALALAQQPKVLLLDEPTSFLDLQHQMEVMTLLRSLNREGMTVIAVLHDLALAGRFAERVLLMSGGHIACDGSPTRIFTAETLERVFNVPMTVFHDPESGRPLPFPR